MNNKITFPELIEMVARKANTTKRVSELFLKELVATSTQALAEGDSVKIKGLGILKLTKVSARKSVDVNTGEEIKIPGHHKLSFVADKGLAEAVNQPFAQFETEVLSDDLTDEQLAHVDDEMEIGIDDTGEGDTAEQEKEAGQPFKPEESEAEAEADVKDAIDALVHLSPGGTTVQDAVNQGTEEGQQEVEKVVDTQELPPAFVMPAVIPSVATQPENTRPEPQEEPQEEPQASLPVEPTEESSELETAVETPLQRQEMAEAEVNEEQQVGNEISKRKHGHRMFLAGFILGVLTSLIVAWVSYRLYMMKYGQKVAQTELSVNEYNHRSPKPVEEVKKQVETPLVPAAKPAQATPEPAPRHEEAKPQPQVVKPVEKPVVKETLNAASTLTRLARKHYGNNFFWVYIYEENKAKIKDPNNIPVGTVVVIPPAEKYGIDKNNPSSVAKAKEKLTEIYNRNAKK